MGLYGIGLPLPWLVCSMLTCWRRRDWTSAPQQGKTGWQQAICRCETLLLGTAGVHTQREREEQRKVSMRKVEGDTSTKFFFSNTVIGEINIVILMI